MKHLTDEHKRIWKKYYSWLDADRLLFVTTNSFYYGRPTGAIVGDRLVPGAIWRDEKTYRPAPEPANEKIDKAIERLYSEGLYSKALQYLDSGGRPGWERYREYNDKNDDPLGRYITYHPLVLKRIYELTEPLLYGQREDIQQLVKEYQGGNRELLTRIKNQLGWSSLQDIKPVGIIRKAENEFSYIGNKEVFTNLAGKFNKKIPKPDTRYSDNSPMGDSEDQRLMLITEPFIFDEADLQQTIDKSLTEALASYKFDKGAKFKTWFYNIFHSDLIDLYRIYQHEWQHGYIVKTFKDYEEKLKHKAEPEADYLNKYLRPCFVEQLTEGQRSWINLYLKMLPDSLRDNLTAKVLNISQRTELRRRKKLQQLFLNNTQIFNKWKTLVIKDKPAKQLLMKQPPANNRQLAMMKKYNEFTNRKWQNGKYIRKSFPVKVSGFFE